MSISRIRCPLDGLRASTYDRPGTAPLRSHPGDHQRGSSQYRSRARIGRRAARIRGPPRGIESTDEPAGGRHRAALGLGGLRAPVRDAPARLGPAMAAAGGPAGRSARSSELSATQAGWLSTVLLLGFTVAAPPIGYAADRLRRSRLLALGFALGSLATVGTGLARTYEQLQAARVLVGVGGAAFMVIALTLLMDLFPRADAGPGAGGLLPGDAAGRGPGHGPGRGVRQGRLADGVPRGRGAGAAAGLAGPRGPRARARMERGRRYPPGSGSTSTSGPAARITSISWSIPPTRIRSSAWRSRRSRSPGWSTGCPRSSPRPRG